MARSYRTLAATLLQIGRRSGARRSRRLKRRREEGAAAHLAPGCAENGAEARHRQQRANRRGQLMPAGSLCCWRRLSFRHQPRQRVLRSGSQAKNGACSNVASDAATAALSYSGQAEQGRSGTAHTSLCLLLLRTHNAKR